MQKKMKALVVRGPLDFAVEAVSYPECPPDGLVLKVQACGLCGSDLRTLRFGHHRVRFPWTIGHEISGHVTELGGDYQGQWRKGDRLAVAPLAYCGKCEFCFRGEFELCENYREIGQHWQGGFAEYLAIPGECLKLGTVLSIPEPLDSVAAAVAEPVSSCVHAQEKGGVGLGDTVVIIGSGPIGCIHVSLARARGADRIIIADINQDRLRLCEPFGPDDSLNSSVTDLVAAVRQLTAGKGADVIITANPAPESQVQAVKMAKKGGRILLFGGLPSNDSYPAIDTNLIHYNALHLIGTTIFNPRHQQIALKLLSAGKIPVEKLVSHRFPLEEFEKGAHMALAGKVLKAVFIP